MMTVEVSLVGTREGQSQMAKTIVYIYSGVAVSYCVTAISQEYVSFCKGIIVLSNDKCPDGLEQDTWCSIRSKKKCFVS